MLKINLKNESAYSTNIPLSSTWKNKSDKKRYWNYSHSNLTQRVVHDCDEQRWSRRVPRLVKLSCGYYIYVLNLKPLKCNKSVSICHWKSEKFYHISRASHGSFGRAICSPSHYWAVLKIFRPCSAAHRALSLSFLHRHQSSCSCADLRDLLGFLWASMFKTTYSQKKHWR